MQGEALMSEKTNEVGTTDVVVITFILGTDEFEHTIDVSITSTIDDIKNIVCQDLRLPKGSLSVADFAGGKRIQRKNSVGIKEIIFLMVGSFCSMPIDREERKPSCISRHTIVFT